MFKLAVSVLLVTIMLQAGLRIDRRRLRSILADRRLIATALLLNVILVPLCGALVVRAFNLTDEVAAGIILMAIAPGLPLLVRKGGTAAGGSVDLAVVLAFILPLVATITVPITANLLLPAGYAAHLPLRQFLATLVLVELLPLIAGTLIAHQAARLASALTTPLTVVLAICAVLAAIGAAPVLYKAIVTAYGSYAILASLAIVLFAFAAGYVLGGPVPEYRNTLAMATSLRNVALAALIATTSFPRTLVPAIVICFFVVQIVVSALLIAVVKRTTHVPKPRPSAGRV